MGVFGDFFTHEKKMMDKKCFHHGRSIRPFLPWTRTEGCLFALFSTIFDILSVFAVEVPGI
jgi:hypothetical protein